MTSPPQELATSLPSDDWRRLHPATPIVRSWRGLLAVLALAVPDSPFQVRTPRFGAAPAVLFLVLGTIGFWLEWRMTRFRLAGPDLVLESGIVFRRSRRVPLARLQAVDVVRPVVARVLGLSELRLEVAGGADSDAKLAYLSDENAQLVRRDLLTLAGGMRDEVRVEASPDGADEVLVAQTPVGMLLAATLLSGSTLSLVVGALVVLASAIFLRQPGFSIPLLVPMFVGGIGRTWTAFARDFGTTLAASPDGLRVRRGLIETRAQTVPSGRVQGVALREPMLWRALGWVGVEVTVAGYAGDSQEHSKTLLPVAPRQLAYSVIARVLPGAAWDTVVLRPAPRRARWRAPVEARRLGVGIGHQDELVVVTRRGRFGRRTDIVPLARAQSVRIRQGPFQRALRLATVYVDLPAGPVRSTALHRDQHEARSLVDRLAADMLTGRDAAPS